MLLALLMALLVCRTHAGGAVWQVVFILPMLVPSVSLGTGLVLLLGANGFLTRLLHLSGSIYASRHCFRAGPIHGPGGLFASLQHFAV